VTPKENKWASIANSERWQFDDTWDYDAAVTGSRYIERSERA
jgi:hypothetical protein